MRKFLIIIAASLAATTAGAQEKRAWETGLGVSALQFNRVGVGGFVATGDGQYVNMRLRHAAYGGNLYVARELCDVLAVDFQGTLGGADDKWLAQTGLGLQWRLGSYFGSHYIDPYVRIGGNYLYKGFDISYGNSRDGMNWEMVNNLNKEGADSRHLCTIALGGGVNMWLNDRLGIGMQGDYIHIPKKNVANSLQGTVRLIWRIGGKSKKPAPATAPAPVIEYREVVVRDTVVVEKRVPVEVERDNVHDLIDAILFDFDRHDLRPEYAEVIEKIASLLKADTSRRFLITGYADVRGSAEYNQTLSYNRAKTVMDALLDKGVPASMLKIAGGGNRIYHAAYATDDHTREGDRKVTIEHITNEDYWEVL